MVYSAEYDSPLGTILLTSDGESLTGLRFKTDNIRPAGAENPVGGDGVFCGAVAWLDGYFGGEVPQKRPPVVAKGTAFQKLIWDLLLEIPYGEIRTYGELAARAAAILGRDTMSAQAVGQAVGANPVAIIIPCHRCVGAGGKLTGYAYGVERKQWLLRHEQKQMEEIL